MESMERTIFFVTLAVVWLLVAYSGRDAPKEKTSKPVSEYAVEVKDDALEELRRQAKTLSQPTDIRHR